MRILSTFALAALLAASGCNGAASQADQEPWQDVLAEKGLAATEAQLSEGEQTEETAFVLGGVRFLRAVEHILQVRYATYQGTLPFIPGMRNPLPPNPDSRFDPAFLETAMTGALTYLSGAEDALGPALDGTFAVEVPLDALWFDFNADGTRQDHEGVLAVMAGLNAEADDGFDGVVRFDTADAEWLAAYVHVLSGMAEMVLAADPTPAIQTVSEGRAALEAAGPTVSLGLIDNEDSWIDTAASVLLTLRGVPDATRTQAAHRHFKAMVEHNTRFWSEVAEEEDDDREWLPNPDQASAFGVEVTAETAEEWQSVLAEIDAILDGEALVPYWRIGLPLGSEVPEAYVPVGLNIGAWMQSPGEMDPVLWIQGAAAAPYLEEGRMADLDAWRRFTRMTGGDSLLFAVWLN